MIAEARNAYVFFIHASAENRAVILLFLAVLLVGLIFEWLWLRERRYRRSLRALDICEYTQRPAPTAIAPLIRNISEGILESLENVILKPAKTLFRILSSSHKASSPVRKDTIQATAPLSLIASKSSTDRAGNQSQVTDQEGNQSIKGRTARGVVYQFEVNNLDF